jgi:NarL family two-component system response regulator LiaR
MTVNILIVDDHAIVRKGLRTLISGKPDLRVIGEAADGVEAIRQAQALKPDVIIMDLQMPRKNGIQAITEIMQANPAVRILVLTSFADDEMVFPAIKAGASGYLLKDTLPNELLTAIRDIHLGRPSLHPTIAEKLMQELAHPSGPNAKKEILTARELEVLRLIAQGQSNTEIAETLFVSDRTVSTHITNILGKLHLANRTQAVLYALREGLVEISAG